MASPFRPNAQRSKQTVAERRAERELLFWTIREALKLVGWIVVCVYVVAAAVRSRADYYDAGREIVELLRILV